MSVYKRENAQHFTTNFTYQGQRINRSTGCTTKRAALAFEADLKKQLRSGKPKESATFLECLGRWLDTECPASQLSHARNVVEYFTPTTTLEQTPAIANKMARTMVKSGLSPLTVNRRLAAIKRVLNLAYKQWDLTEFPYADKVTTLSEKNTQRSYFLTKEQVQELADACDHPVVRDIVLVAAGTGLRKGELFALTADDKQDGFLFVRKAKGGLPRQVPLTRSLKAVSIPFEVGEGTFRLCFKRARAATGFEHIRFHDLRHTYASHLAQQNVSQYVLQQVMGHSDPRLTARYSHLRPGDVGEILGALEA